MENLYIKYIRHIRHFGEYAACLKDRADRAETKLHKIIDEIDRIIDDYIPDNDKMAPLALDEMREAIGTVLEMAKEE